MSDRWLEYFGEQKPDNPGWLKSAVNHWSFMQHFYGELQRIAPPGAKLLDIGCGMGFTDLYLASMGYRVTGIDNDGRIIERASAFSEITGIDAEFKLGDAFDLSAETETYEVAFSLGVLEHFDREVTIELLQEQAKCARQVMICIPTQYTAYAAPITDERIYTISQLRKIVADADLEVTRSFGFGDVTVTPKQVWIRRLLPQGVYRYMQNRGFAFNICVVGACRKA